MGNYSEFKSRKAIAKCSDETFFRFATDLRNFDHIAGGKLSDWKADVSLCSFTVSPLGKIIVELTSSEPTSKIQYAAVTSLTGKIDLDVSIEHIDAVSSGVTLTFGLELSPFLRMMVSSQADDYLDRLVLAIEEFEEYKG